MAHHQARRQSTFRPEPEPLESRVCLSTTNASYVASVYQDVQHRSASAQEVGYWTQQLQGGASAIAFATGLVNSVEHRTAEINHDYQSLLGRAPAANDTAYYQNAFAQGAHSDDVMTSFLTSPEYKGLHQGNTAYVNALYNDVLGRDAEAAGQAYYVNILDQGANPVGVVPGFLHSPERAGQVVDQSYASILRRTDNPVEHQAQVDLLVFGGSRPENVVIGALTSPEYAKRHNGTAT